MKGIAVFVELVTSEGCFDECYRLFLEHAAASRNEPGCIRFDVTIPEGSSNSMMLYELYADRESFEAHSNSERIQRHREKSHPLLSDKRLVVCEAVEQSLDLTPIRCRQKQILGRLVILLPEGLRASRQKHVEMGEYRILEFERGQPSALKQVLN